MSTLFFRSIICIRFVAPFCWKLFVLWRTYIVWDSLCLLCFLDLSFVYDLLRPYAGSCLCASAQLFFSVFYSFFCFDSYIWFRLHFIFSSLHFICLAVGFSLCAGAPPLFGYFFIYFFFISINVFKFVLPCSYFLVVHQRTTIYED